MKQIKLEVGKTYINRKGEEVKIVRKDNTDRYYPYQGSDLEWYTENGRYAYSGPEHRKDLIEELPEPRYAFTIPNGKEITAARYTFAIPDGATKLTVEQVSNRIIVEMVPETKEPKPGDVMINKYNNVYIFKEVSGARGHKHYAWLWRDRDLTYNSVATAGRPATPEEAQPLWDALKKAGKRWNSETMQVEDVPEIDRIREWAKQHLVAGPYNQEGIAQVISRYIKHKEGEK